MNAAARTGLPDRHRFERLCTSDQNEFLSAIFALPATAAMNGYAGSIDAARAGGLQVARCRFGACPASMMPSRCLEPRTGGVLSAKTCYPLDFMVPARGIGPRTY
jgi:hypothetical protein